MQTNYCPFLLLQPLNKADCTFASKNVNMEEETINKLPLTITPAALQQLREIRAKMHVPVNFHLKIGVKNIDASKKFDYDLRFAIKTDKDDIYEFDGMKVYMEKEHISYLSGMELDWVVINKDSGFSFEKGKASGC